MTSQTSGEIEIPFFPGKTCPSFSYVSRMSTRVIPLYFRTVRRLFEDSWMNESPSVLVCSPSGSPFCGLGEALAFLAGFCGPPRQTGTVKRLTHGGGLGPLGLLGLLLGVGRGFAFRHLVRIGRCASGGLRVLRVLLYWTVA